MATQRTPLPRFGATRQQIEVIAKIAARAEKLAESFGFEYRRGDAMMDLDACISNGCPLKLADLLEADDGNFGHDVFGIRRHINRSTGALEGGFCPRFALANDVSARRAS